MEIEDIRILNLNRLIDEKFGGKKATFARSIGKDPSYVSRWFTDRTKKGRRNIKSPTAREIERKCNKPPGWLDRYTAIKEHANTEYNEETTMEGHTPPQNRGETNQMRTVPLISWEEAINWPESKHKRGNEVTHQRIKTDQNLGPDGYALEITSDYYINPNGGQSILPGSIIYVDRDARPDNGSAVVVHIRGNK